MSSNSRKSPQPNSRGSVESGRLASPPRSQTYRTVVVEEKASEETETVYRQPLYRKVALGGITASQVNRWNEKNNPEKFEPGLDSGLRSWAALRRSLAAVATGELVIPETIPSRIKYRSGRTYYDKSVIRMTGAFLSEVLKEKEEKEAREAAEAAAPPSAALDLGEDARQEDEDEDEDHDDEDETEERVETATINGKPGAKSAPYSVLKNLKAPEVNIIRPDFTALTIAQFEEVLRTQPAKEVLLCAYHHFHWRYFDMALDAGLSLETNITGRTGKTLLFIAVENGDTERVEYLLGKCANPNARDHRGDTPLHLCMRHPIVFHPRAIAAELCRKGANVNAQNKRGTTPLHRAILLGFMDYVELLLKRRAKVFVFDKNGKMPISYAGVNESRVAKLMNQNVRFCGKRQHEEMWAYIMSRQFVPGIFSIVSSACLVCKRKTHDCAALKKSDFRYWLYVHEILARKKPVDKQST